jgi:hypothetical protein
MFFNSAEPDTIQYRRRQASKELQNVINREWQAEYSKVLQAGIAAGLQDEELENFVQRIKLRVQLKIIAEFQKELKRIATAKQETKKSSTLSDELTAEKKQSQHPTDDNHEAKRVKSTTLQQK